MVHNVSTTALQQPELTSDVPVKTITIILVFLIILSVLGNSLVCCAFIIQPRLRRVLYYPVLNLAIADILCGLVAMTSYLAKKHVFGGRKQQVICDISRFSYFTTEYASIFSLTIISVDRALAILRPLKYQTTMTSKRMKVILAVIWLVAILVSSLPFVLPNHELNDCLFEPTNAWSVSVIVLNVLTPFAIIVICQTSIYCIAIKHAINIRRQKRVALRANTTRRGSTPRMDAWVVEKRATVALSIVIGLFLLCWGPSSFYYFIQKVNPEHFKGTFGKKQGTFNAIVKLMTFANSCFNPFIYAWLNKDFRNAFLRVVSRRFYQSAVTKQIACTASQHEQMKLHLNNKQGTQYKNSDSNGTRKLLETES